jgi:hypothetical protein
VVYVRHPGLLLDRTPKWRNGGIHILYTDFYKIPYSKLCIKYSLLGIIQDISLILLLHRSYLK